MSSGSASIALSTTATTITQSSPRAVIDWTGFDVGRQQSVTFVQPGASSVTLNRVNAADPSQIAGKITGNGQIIIENRAGIVVADGAQIDAKAVVLSAAGISNRSFMAGGTSFTEPAKPGASVVNRGTITVREAGLAALVAPNVRNDGVIEARGGQVVLQGASTFKVDLYGDGLLSFEAASLGEATTVRNGGTISAPGGRVLLSAVQADRLVTGLVEAGGRISADSAGRMAGSIRIQSTGGSITIDGTMSAAGRGAGQTGGSVVVATPGAVTLNSGATIDVSGRAGGGSVALGTRAGVTAKTTTVAAGASVLANATDKGRGGRVKILSDQNTTMAGHISAEGGPRGGAGGNIEVSGHQGFTLTGAISVSAVAGPAGTILLDPQDLTIRSGGADGGLLQPAGGDGTLAAGSNGGAPVPIAAVIDPAAIAGLTGNVVLQAARDLSVQSAVTSSAASLSLQAGRNLTVNAPISLPGAGTLTLAAAVSAFAGQPGYDTGGPNGVLTIAPSGGVGAPLAQVNLSSGVGGVLANGPITANGLTVNALNSGAFTLGGTVQANNFGVSAGQIALNGAVHAASVQLATSPGGSINATGNFSAQSLGVTAGSAAFTGSAINVGTLTSAQTDAGFTLMNAADLLAIGTLSAGGGATPLPANASGLLLSATGTLTLGRAASPAILAAGTVGLAGGGGIIEANGGITANLLTGTVPGSSVVTSAATLTGNNAVGSFGAMSVTGPLVFGAGSGFNVVGSVHAGGAMTLSAGGTLALGTPSHAAILSAASLRLIAGGAITQPNAAIAAGTLSASAAAIALGGANRIGVLAGASASGDISIADQIALTIAAPVAASGSVFVNTGTGGVTLAAPTSAGPGGTIAFTGDSFSWPSPATNPLNASSTGTIAIAPATAGLGMTLGPGGGLALSSTAGMTAATLQVGAAAPASGAAVVVTAGSLLISGFDTAVLGVLSLNASGAITQTAALTGPARLDVAAGRAVLGTPGNAVATLGTVVTSGDFSFTDNTGVALLGLLQAGTVSAPSLANTATVQIQTPGSIAIGSTSIRTVVNAGTVVLLGGGAINEINGTIGANTLSGPQDGGAIASASYVALRGINTVTTLSAFQTTGNFAFVNAGGLVIGGAVTAGTVPAPDPRNTATLSLQAGGDLTLGGGSQIGALSAGRIDLIASGAITEPRGVIEANTLNGPGQGAAFTAAASVALTGSNQFAVLGNFAANGAIRIYDGTGMIVTGIVSAGAGGGNTPGNTASAELLALGDLRIGQSGTPSVINAGTVSLLSTGAILELSGGIVANQLNGPGPGAAIGQALTADLHGTNIVNRIGRFVASGGFSMSDIASVTVVGTVSVGPAATAAITTTGSMTIGQAGSAALLSGGTISLLAAGAIAESSASSINATLLTGPFPGLAIAAATEATLSGINAVAQISQFNVTGSLIFRNRADLTVTGTLSAGNVAAPDARNTSAIGLIVAGDLALGTASAPALLNAGTVGLAVTGTLSEPAGMVVAGLLHDLRTPGAPATASAILLSGSNTIAAIGEFGARGNIYIQDNVPLTVAGTITAGGVQAPDAANGGKLSLVIDGTLAIGDAGRPGALNAGTVVLMPSGAITEPNGAITANRLVLPAAGQAIVQTSGVDLAGQNAISVLAAIDATGDVFINSTSAMSVAGPIAVGATPAPNLANTATLTLASASDIAIAANLMAGTISLQSAGTLSQSGGILTANRLSGPAAGLAQAVAGAVTLEGANTIAELGAFTLAGNFLLNDIRGLTVAGAVSAGGTAVPLAANGATLRITSGGTIAIGTPVQAASLSAGTVTLLTAAAISEGATGSIAAQTLRGPNPAATIPAASAVNLTGTNSIATLTSFSTTGDFVLANAAPMQLTGTIAAGGGASPNLAHLAIGLSAGALTLGTAGEAGVLSAGTIALAAAAGIVQPNGRISAALLSDQTGLAGVPQSASVSLPSASNLIAALATMNALSGDLVLNSSGAMTVIGPVNASQRLAVSVTGAMTVLGNVSGGDGGLRLSGDLGIQQVSGGITASTSGAALLSLTSAHGNIVQFPNAAITSATSAIIAAQGSISLGESVLVPGGVLTLTSTAGGISQSSSTGTRGTILVQTVSANAAGSILLDSSSNRIGAINGISSGGRLVLNSTLPMLIVGDVVTAADASITGTKAVEQVAGSILAGGAGVQVLSRLGSFTQDHGAVIGATGNDGTVSLTALAAGATIDVGGVLSAVGGNALVSLSVPLGGILELASLPGGAVVTQGGGRIVATRLTATALDTIALDGVGSANAVGTLEAMTSTNGAIGLLNTTPLKVNGIAHAPAGIMLQSLADLTLGTSAGVLVDAGSAVLRAGASMQLQNGSKVSAPDVSLIAPNIVAVGGTLWAPRLLIGGANGAASGLVVLGDGAILQTGEAALPPPTAATSAWPSYAGSTTGAFISAQNLTIGWSSAIRGVSGSASQTLRVDLSGSGVIDPVNGLSAETTTLLINLGSRANLSGNVTLGGLYLAYPRGARGSVALSGTVRGVGGQAAAQISSITPGPNALYQINACPIASVACFVVSTERLPQTVPIRDLDIRPAHDTVDEAEILLPNVSRDDF